VLVLLSGIIIYRKGGLTMSTLYELQEEYRNIYDMPAQGEIDEQTFSDCLEGICFDEQLETKAEGYAKVIRMLEYDADTAKAEAARLSSRRSSFENNAQRMRERLYTAMKITGREKFKTPLFSFNNQATAEKVVVDDINALQSNDDYWKPRKWDESELDKSKIKEALQSGQNINGAHLEKGESLRIR